MPIGLKEFSKQQAVATSDKQSIVGGAEFSTADSVPTKLLYRGLTFDEMERMYLANVWVRACVDRIRVRLLDIQPTVRFFGPKPSNDAKRHREEIEKLFVDPNGGAEDFDSLRSAIDKDILVYDAAAMEVVEATDAGTGKRAPFEIYSVAGDTIKKNVDKRGVFRDVNSAYHQIDETGRKVAEFPIGSLVYMMLNPSAGRIYGLSKLESLRQTVTAELYASQYTLDFFSNDATPRFAVLFDNLGMGQADAAMKRVRAWWEHELRGKPHRPILMGTEQGQVRFQQVGLSNQDMQFQEYSKWLLIKIMAIFGMQPFVLGVVDSSTGKLNSEQQGEQFKKDALAPQLRLFRNMFNSNVIRAHTGFGFDDVYMDWLAFLPKDEKTQAQIHKYYWEMGALTVNMIREQLGYEPIDEEWADSSFIPNNYAPVGSVSAAPPQPADGAPEPEIKRVDPSLLFGLKGVADEADLTDTIIGLLKQRESFLNKTFSFPAQALVPRR